MTGSRPPGPIGSPGVLDHFDPGEGTELFQLPHDATPGPIGLALSPVVFASPKTPASKAVGRALIVIGAGHDDLADGVRYKGKKYFRQAALGVFDPYTKGHDVTLKFVTSAKDMTKLLEGDTWNVVLYFGHGVLNRQELMPGYGSGGPSLKKDSFAAALKRSNAAKIYLFGCNAGFTGLARAVSKQLPSATVHGTFGELDVEWRQEGKGKRVTENKFVLKEPLVEFKGGFQTNNGAKTKQRRREIGDPISLDGDPLGEDLIDQ